MKLFSLSAIYLFNELKFVIYFFLKTNDIHDIKEIMYLLSLIILRKIDNMKLRTKRKIV